MLWTGISCLSLSLPPSLCRLCAGERSGETGGVIHVGGRSLRQILTFRTAPKRGSPVTGRRAEVMAAGRQLPAGRAASGACGLFFFFFLGRGGTPRGTEAPRARGLFSWKLVRIKSLPCGPLCPAEVDKHDWSRSETSPRGKKSRAGWERQQKDLGESRTREEWSM